MHPHILESDDAEQVRLLAETVRMGGMAASQLEAALDVVQQRDDHAAARVVAADGAIDALEREVSHDVMRLALHGPMARDLREILAALRIAADIERIGDHAANVARRSIALNACPPQPQVAGLQHIGRMALRQVRDVLSAYRAGDVDAACRVRDADAALDAAYTTLFRELLGRMMQDARAVTPGAHLLFMAKNIERIGDHATNIAENVWFLVRGEAPLPARPKADDSGTMAP
jgi:phosphate transport system protein